MTLSKKFKLAAGTGFLSAAILLTGCSGSMTSSVTPQETQQGYVSLPEQCTVIDLKADAFQIHRGAPYEGTTYNFRVGVVTFNSFTGLSRSYLGSPSSTSVTMPMKDLAEDGQARAVEMYSKLPASAQCKAPKFGG